MELRCQIHLARLATQRCLASSALAAPPAELFFKDPDTGEAMLPPSDPQICGCD